jgi:HEAT repeat protein
MKAAVSLLCCSLAAATAFAQPPRVVNARLSARAAEPDLPRAIAAITAQQVDPAWLGYAVPIFSRAAGERQGSQDAWSERCRLEQTNVDGAATSAIGASGPIRLEPSPTLLVLMRVQNREVQRIRTFSTDCAIDAGGLAVYWLDGVNSSQSVAFLKGFVTGASSRGTSDGALAAVSLHQDPSAAAALLDLAKNSTDARVRQRALFWVARRAESQAIPAISDAIERDPDLEVKKQAVFALSQLPKDQGIPLLIKLARTHGNPAVRKQAMFWLGQSRDARAIGFFEEILR